jgi:hypothetical protein
MKPLTAIELIDRADHRSLRPVYDMLGPGLYDWSDYVTPLEIRTKMTEFELLTAILEPEF